MERADRFEERRPHLRGIAYRLLGSFADVDDVLQDAWLRYDSVEVGDLDNVDAWLTTVVGRLCLNRLRDRTTRREVLEARFPDVLLSTPARLDPEQAALLGDRLGVALLVVLDRLAPAERVALVLHDAFAVPFDVVAEVLRTTPAAARQLASRARRRLGTRPVHPERDAARERAVVDAFLAAADHGDFDALVTVLHPDAVLRSDGGSTRPAASTVLRGSRSIAGDAVRFGGLSRMSRAVLVNGAPGVLTSPKGVAVSLMVFEVEGDSITAIDVLADPERLSGLSLR